MNDECGHGIILRTRPLTETSLIVQWLTADLGRIATVAKGARRQKSPFLGKLDLYYEADFTFQRARKSNLHTLREINLTSTRPFLRTEFAALEQAATAGRRIEKTTEEETPLPEIYELFHAYLEELSKPPVQVVSLFSFEIKLLETLGFGPEFKGLNAGAARALEQLAKVDFNSSRRIKLSAAQASEIETYLEERFREAMQ